MAKPSFADSHNWSKSADERHEENLLEFMDKEVISMSYQEYRKDAMTCLVWHASGCRICWILSIVFALVGVIAAAREIMLGLGAANWLLLATAAFVASIPCCIAWIAGLFLYAIEAESK